MVEFSFSILKMDKNGPIRDQLILFSILTNFDKFWPILTTKPSLNDM